MAIVRFGLILTSVKPFSDSELCDTMSLYGLPMPRRRQWSDFLWVLFMCPPTPSEGKRSLAIVLIAAGPELLVVFLRLPPPGRPRPSATPVVLIAAEGPNFAQSREKSTFRVSDGPRLPIPVPRALPRGYLPLAAQLCRGSPKKARFVPDMVQNARSRGRGEGRAGAARGIANVAAVGRRPFDCRSASGEHHDHAGLSCPQ